MNQTSPIAKFAVMVSVAMHAVVVTPQGSKQLPAQISQPPTWRAIIAKFNMGSFEAAFSQNFLAGRESMLGKWMRTLLIKKPIQSVVVLLMGLISTSHSDAQSAPLEILATPQTVKVVRSYCAEGDLKDVYPVHAHCDVKLGLPKVEAAGKLSAEHRAFLDGVSRLYHAPELMAQRRLAISLIGAEIEKTTFFEKRRGVGISYRERNDHFNGVGIFKPFSYWVSYYQYMINPYDREKTDYRWISRISVTIDHTTICIPGRAAEGYLDIPLSTVVFGVVDGEKPRERWHRHEGGGTAIAEPLSPLHPQLKLGFIKECLAGIELTSTFNIKDTSDANIHN